MRRNLGELLLDTVVGVLIFVVALWFLGRVLPTPALGHEHYPHHCCNERDCAPITGTRHVWKDGKIAETWISTKFGEAIVVEGGTLATDILPSHDGAGHACFRMWSSNPKDWSVRCWIREGGV